MNELYDSHTESSGGTTMKPAISTIPVCLKSHVRSLEIEWWQSNKQAFKELNKLNKEYNTSSVTWSRGPSFEFGRDLERLLLRFCEIRDGYARLLSIALQGGTGQTSWHTVSLCCCVIFVVRLLVVLLDCGLQPVGGSICAGWIVDSDFFLTSGTGRLCRCTLVFNWKSVISGETKHSDQH